MGNTGAQRSTHEHADKDGHFRRKDSSFRDWISRDPNSKFPAEKGRYALYCNLGCPWAHRTILVRVLKDLEDIIQVIYTDFDLSENGWLFTGRNGSSDRDPLYGFVGLKQLYLKADPDYVGRYTVPTLWDKKTETIVNNESSEIIRMFYTEFDDLIEPRFRESTKGPKGLYPEHLRSEINDMNEWIYHTINNGVYKVGFATTQEAYDNNLYPLFSSLDRLESHLSNPQSCHGGPFLFGSNITEADIRLYTTIARFDTAYHTIFMCNLKSIRSDYHRLYRWFRRIYHNASELPKGKVFKETTAPEIYRFGYTNAKRRQTGGADAQNKSIVVPRGPVNPYDPWTEDDEDIDNGRRIALQHILEKNGNGTDTNGTATPTSASTATDFANLSINNSTSTPTNGTGTYKTPKTDLTSEHRAPRTATSSAPNMGSFVTKGDDIEANGEIDPARKLTRKNTTTYEDQNAKWYKAAKKAEKKSGVPHVHLAC
ncbi:hypothetical protein PMZ80_007201 [Knufia obscura]|uniref:GST C-terminal domain-containing protein n=1 Tax=Knufia obscura TaxID=1635080 RepID=A0ABR0RJJ1_9EURO|nr:hypothetical protein PMZ80_007201 [Knufia obscura]